MCTAVATPAAFGQNMPSAKSTVAIANLTALGVAAFSNPSPDSGWVPILMNYIKTASQKDLAFDVALQCGLVTDTTVKSKRGDKDSASAKGSIRVRVKVTNMVTGEVRYAEPSMDFNGVSEGVTYCSRFQQLDAQFAGLDCTADLLTGAVTCENPESLRLLLSTLNANAFNFFLANMVSGEHEVVVEAIVEASVELSGTELGAAKAEAFIGLGAMHVDEVRLIKGDSGMSK